MSNEKLFFDELKRKLEFLDNNPDRDNEATRHDLIIYPIITNKFGLGWNPIDIISQSTINVPENISESHIFRGAIPKIRKPDLIICPNEIVKNLAVIEEKKKQTDLFALKDHRIQLSEYQSLYECNWGILTDGEKWLIKKGFETFHEFGSIGELEKGIYDFRNALGSLTTLDRYRKYNTFDLILISPFGPMHLDPFPEFSNLPTIVVGVEDLKITESGLGFKEYSSFRDALKDFPDLHPKLTTNRFTWAMEEIKNKEIIKLRFETWKAYDLYSN
ncbi:hypothetical protein BWK58_03985 [Flavobacterium columnare]|nr:hypothetical protein BWK58_03985 [Flavobacterium columnare]